MRLLVRSILRTCFAAYGMPVRLWWRLKQRLLIYDFNFDPATAFMHAALVKRYWNYLGLAGTKGQPLRIAVFGAGRHTAWLHTVVKNEREAPSVVAVLDVKEIACIYWGLKPTAPESLNPETVDAILLSTDTLTERMRRECARLYGDTIRTIDFYEGIPHGPYIKKEP